MEDLLKCIVSYDKTETLENKGRHFEIIQRDAEKIMSGQPVVKRKRIKVGKIALITGVFIFMTWLMIYSWREEERLMERTSIGWVRIKDGHVSCVIAGGSKSEKDFLKAKEELLIKVWHEKMRAIRQENKKRINKSK